jgi:hypothetical protein
MDIDFFRHGCRTILYILYVNIKNSIMYCILIRYIKNYLLKFLTIYSFKGILIDTI